MKRTIEIRQAEGGEDSALFTKDLAEAYIKMCGKLGWKHRLISSRLGEIHIEVEGTDLSKLYNECGGHRIQRVPPTERKGRVHTSTVTVAVTDPTVFSFVIADSDLRIEWYSGTGAGGQNRNKVKTSCRITHVPTGVVSTSQTRERTNSLKLARADIADKIETKQRELHDSAAASDRRDQVGSGMRGDKIRTYRFQDDTVTDHCSGKRISLRKVLSGDLALLW